MAISFHRIAYETLPVCNGVTLDTVEAAIAVADLPSGARALDLGCGNATVAILMARRFGLDVRAIEADPGMAELARARIRSAEMREQVQVIQARSGDVLAEVGPADLIVALGATDPAGLGRGAPADTFAGLTSHLRPGGWLLWGDLTWRGEPSQPLRTLVEITNLYTDDDGWRDAARAAGLDLVSSEISPQSVWDDYTHGLVHAADAWLIANADAPEAEQVRFHRNRVHAMFEFGRPWLSFGLYLMRRPG